MKNRLFNVLIVPIILFALTGCNSATKTDTVEKEEEEFEYDFSEKTSDNIYEGVYNGYSLYITNKHRPEEGNCCINRISVNGDVTTKLFDDAAYEIDFSGFNLKCGDPVRIKIDHYDLYCDNPYKILNLEVIDPDYGCKADTIDRTFEDPDTTKRRNGVSYVPTYLGRGSTLSDSI